MAGTRCVLPKKEKCGLGERTTLDRLRGPQLPIARTRIAWSQCQVPSSSPLPLRLTLYLTLPLLSLSLLSSSLPFPHSLLLVPFLRGASSLFCGGYHSMAIISSPIQLFFQYVRDNSIPPSLSLSLSPSPSPPPLPSTTFLIPERRGGEEERRRGGEWKRKRRRKRRYFDGF